MKLDHQLQLQAYLDGELSARAARRVAQWLARNPEARALEAELRMTKAALAGNEPEVTVPESRQFYWSKIERAIRAAQARPDQRPTEQRWFVAWRRLLVPASALAVAALVAGALALFGPSRSPEAAWSVAVVDTLSEHVCTHSFRSLSDKMFVIWIEQRAQAQPGELWQPEGWDDDIIIQ